MFETLQPVDRPVARGWPLFMYGTYCVGGLAFVIIGLTKHGLSRPVHLGISFLMFCLSLTWLVATLKSRTPLTTQDTKYRGIALLVLLMALNSLSLFR